MTRIQVRNYNRTYAPESKIQRAAIVTRIRNGELHFGKAARHIAPVADAAVAMAALLAGQTIYLKQWGPLVSEVQRRITALEVTA